MKIETKYSIGDAVYWAGTETERKQHPCPDCLGERQWKAISPAGSEMTFSCPRCASPYQSRDELSLTYSAYAPVTRRLTVGSVQYNSEPSYDNGARYMCVETGVGSGSVYDGARLFPTEEEALAAATRMAAEQNSTVQWVVKLYDKTLSLSDYQLENALTKAAADHRSRTSSMLWNLSDLFDAIEGAEGKEEILEVINDYRTYHQGRDVREIQNSIEASFVEAMA